MRNILEKADELIMMGLAYLIFGRLRMHPAQAVRWYVGRHVFGMIKACYTNHDLSLMKLTNPWNFSFMRKLCDNQEAMRTRKRFVDLSLFATTRAESPAILVLCVPILCGMLYALVHNIDYISLISEKIPIFSAGFAKGVISISLLTSCVVLLAGVLQIFWSEYVARLLVIRKEALSFEEEVEMTKMEFALFFKLVSDAQKFPESEAARQIIVSQLIAWPHNGRPTPPFFCRPNGQIIANQAEPARCLHDSAEFGDPWVLGPLKDMAAFLNNTPSCLNK